MQELVVGRLLNLDQVRHLGDFLDLAEELANALAAGERLRHVDLAPHSRCRSPGAGRRWTRRSRAADAAPRRTASAELQISPARPDPDGRRRSGLTPADAETAGTGPGEARDRLRFDDGAASGRSVDYLSSTLAPAFSSCALIFSASSLDDAFLDGLRRAFDQVLGFLEAEPGDRADFLDHFDLLVAGGGEDDRELGLLLDRRGGRAPAAGPAATATAAAAETPHFSSSSLASSAASRTVRLDRSSTIFARSAIVRFLLISVRTVGFVKSRPQAASSLLGIGPEHAGELGGRRVDDLSDLGRRGLDEAQSLARSSSRDGSVASAFTPSGFRAVLPMAPPRITNFSLILGEIHGDLGRRDRIARISDQGRTLQQGPDRGDVRAFESNLGEAVLGDLHGGAGLLHLLAQLLHLGDRQAGIVGHDDHATSSKTRR